MKYDEEVITSPGVIYATVSGKVEPEKLATLGKQSRQRAYDSGLRFLVDLTRATDLPTVVTVHTWFSDFYESMELHLKWVPTAHLCSPKDIELFTFVETSWTNRGAIVRAFTDREAALEWLGGIRTRTP